jgi:phosphate transport system permease protein
LAGALTLALLVLPIVIIASREALRAVPTAIREGAYAIGATRWETVRHQVLPAAIPGMMTGTILALSRAIGETAPLITLGAFTYLAFDPEPLSPFTAMPIQILNWVVRPQEDFARLAAAASLVLLVVLLAMNAVAIWIRARARREW